MDAAVPSERRAAQPVRSRVAIGSIGVAFVGLPALKWVQIRYLHEWWWEVGRDALVLLAAGAVASVVRGVRPSLRLLRGAAWSPDPGPPGARPAVPAAVVWASVVSIVLIVCTGVLSLRGSFGAAQLLGLALVPTVAALVAASRARSGVAPAPAVSAIAWTVVPPSVVWFVALELVPLLVSRPGPAPKAVGEMVVLLCLTAPVEELVFRGLLLLAALEPWLLGWGPSGPIPAEVRNVIVLAAAFACWHVPDAVCRGESLPLTLLVTFLGGLAFTIARLRGRSLLAPILLHAAFNGSGTAFGFARPG